MKNLIPFLSLFVFLQPESVLAASRTSPPDGALVVQLNTTTPGAFANLTAAAGALPDDGSSQTIFMFPGKYEEQVLIQRSGPVTILGYTEDTMDFSQNQVSLSHSASLATAGSDDATGTLRIKTNFTSLYNIDFINEYGELTTAGQAIALSQYGFNFGAYACRFFSYQDTLYANQGTQVYIKSYIEGGVDFIFGREGNAYFQGNTIASKGAGCVTANGRETNDTGIYLFENNSVIAAGDAFANETGNVFLGRPWGNYSRVVFKDTYIGSELNKDVWSIWDIGDERTNHVFYAEFNSFGPGVVNATRPSFSTLLTSDEAEAFTIASTVGDDYADWVDLSYLS